MDDPEASTPANGSDQARSDEPRTASASERRLAWLARRRRERAEGRPTARFAEHLPGQWAQQLAQARALREQQAQPELVVTSGRSNFSRAEVPYGVDLAAAWAWRFLVIVLAGWVIAQGVQMITVVLIPVVVALFIAALTIPAVEFLARWLPRGTSSLLVVIGLLGSVALMLTFATQQVTDRFNDLSVQVVEGLDEIQDWLRDGPLHVSDAQVSSVLQEMQEVVASSNAQIVGRVTEVGSAVGHIVAGFFIVLFATYFFLADGNRIWLWVVRLFPRAARSRADSSGRVAWLSLTRFVRATVLVAGVDAVGIMIVAGVLKVPFVLAIGVLVFLGGFVPLIGATITGAVAVLVALVAQGPLVALFMLLGVIAVQQLEAHVLQPFLLGRMVAIHPLAVILAVATGVMVAGVAGALVAVPVVASVNAVAVHLAGHGMREDSGEDDEPDGAEGLPDPAEDRLPDPQTGAPT